MKTKNLFNLAVLSAIIMFSSCKKDSTTPTPLACTVDAPVEYAFTHEGSSTVSFTGQAGRLATAKTVYDILNANPLDVSATITRANLDVIIDNDNSKLITKTAENSVNRAVVIDHLNGILDTYCENSAAYDLGTVASAGTAGLYDGFQLDANGWEADQQFAKMLIGALCLEQVNYDYLTKMGDDATDNVERDVYTQREHYYDEAFGYIYGMDADISTPAIDEIAGNKYNFLGKYLSKHDGSNYSMVDYRQRAYDAFKMGRQAVVENCSEELNRQIAIINSSLSKVVAWHAQSYLTSAASKLGTAEYHHDVSEAWGFVYSLQFTKVDGAPLFSHSEVIEMISTLEAGTNGAWDLNSDDLLEMAATINSAVVFD